MPETNDQNVVGINTLRKEIEDLRYLLNEKNRSNNEYQAEIGSVRDQISRREQECVALQREVSVKHIEESIEQHQTLNIEATFEDQQAPQLHDQNNPIDLKDIDNNSMTMQNIFNADPDGIDANQLQYNLIWVQNGDQMG